MAAGLAAERHWGPRTGRVARRVMTLQLYLLVPVVVFPNITRESFNLDTGVAVLIGWLALLACGVVAYAVATRVLGLDRPQTGSLINVAMQGNTGYFGLPLAAALFGVGRLGDAAAYDSLVQGPVFFIVVFAVAAAFGTHAGETLGARVRAFLTRNPVIWAVVAALLAPDALAPDWLVDLSRVIVFTLLPFGFFAVGVTLSEEAEDGALAWPPPFGAREAAAVGLRLVVAPALLLALAAPAVDLPNPWVLLAAMPAGLNGLVVAHAYGLDLGYTASAIAWTTAIVVVAGLVATAIL